MVDIHSHILFGLDDGPAELEESVAMVEMAAESGTTDIVATPHASAAYHYDPALVAERIATVQQAVGSAVRLFRGCDFRLMPQHLEEALTDRTRYSINGGSYILVEFAEEPLQAGLEMLATLLEAGFVPVITHPERNRFLSRHFEQLQFFLDLGCCIQVTAQSLLGDFGSRTKACAEAMFEKGLVQIVASDGHDLRHRPPVLEPVRRHLGRKYGAEAAVAVLETNPRAVLRGSLLPEPKVCPQRSFHIWQLIRSIAGRSARRAYG